MRSLAKIRLAGPPAAVLAALSFAAATSALAADGAILNEQLQLGDVFTTQVLDVQEAPEGLAGTATAVGNIASGTGRQQPLDFRSQQTLGARVEAAADALVEGETGKFFSLDASATGNSGTAGTCCAPTTGSSIQTIRAGSVVTADLAGETHDNAATISADASAVGNTQGWNQIGGEIRTWTQQTNAGSTAATNTGRYVGGPGNIGLSATSVANNVSADLTDAPFAVGVEQTRSGRSSAHVDATIGWGSDVQSTATATGNLVDARTRSPEADLNVKQASSGGLDANSTLRLDEWSGDASSVAYGVGNSVLVSNIGPLTSLYVEQRAAGDVAAAAVFDGREGGAVHASSTAMGNAASGYACSECETGLDVYNSQTNDGRIRSQTTIVSRGRAGLISADSTAVGNSATYRVFSNGGE